MKINRAFGGHRVKSSQAGNILVMVAISLAVLLGFVGLAIDVSYLEHVKRRMQTAADSAALAGAWELVRGATPCGGTCAAGSQIAVAALDDAARNGFDASDASKHISIIVNEPPATGFYTGSPAVEVIITQTDQPMFFIQVLAGNSPGTVSARAVAHLAAGDGCIFILNDASAAYPDPRGPTLTISGTTRMNLPDCPVQVNSGVDSYAVKCNGTVDLDFDLNVVGGANCEQAAGVYPSLPQPDPLGEVPEPAVPTTCDHSVTVDIPSAAYPPGADGYTHLPAGTYCGGINISTGGKVIFDGGTYFINNGGFKMTGGTALGTGVMFYITGTLASGTPSTTYQPVTINGGNFGCTTPFCGFNSTFTAPSSGDYAGILFFGDRDIAPALNDPSYKNTIGGNANFAFNGILYFKTGMLELGGTGDMSATNTAIVADEGFIHGTPTFNGDLSAMPGGARTHKAVLGE